VSDDLDDDHQHAKRLSTLRARLALLGYQLSQLAAGGWLIHRHDASTACEGLREVAAFADQAEGSR
jgi:hypothetical protein